MDPLAVAKSMNGNLTSSGRYISRGIEEFENFVVGGPRSTDARENRQRRLNKITLRSSQAEDAELPATQTLSS